MTVAALLASRTLIATEAAIVGIDLKVYAGSITALLPLRTANIATKLV